MTTHGRYSLGLDECFRLRVVVACTSTPAKNSMGERSTDLPERLLSSTVGKALAKARCSREAPGKELWAAADTSLLLIPRDRSRHRGLGTWVEVRTPGLPG